MALNKMISSTP